MDELNKTKPENLEKEVLNKTAFVCPVDPAELAQCDSCQ